MLLIRDNFLFRRGWFVKTDKYFCFVYPRRWYMQSIIECGTHDYLRISSESIVSNTRHLFWCDKEVILSILEHEFLTDKFFDAMRLIRLHSIHTSKAKKIADTLRKYWTTD